MVLQVQKASVLAALPGFTRTSLRTFCASLVQRPSTPPLVETSANSALPAHPPQQELQEAKAPAPFVLRVNIVTLTQATFVATAQLVLIPLEKAVHSAQEAQLLLRELPLVKNSAERAL
jgi:hypothetical protein